MKISVKDLCTFLDREVPLSFQESWDNSGLQVLAANDEISSALLTVDVTEEVLDEAVTLGCGLIISHHPLIFHPLKRLTGSTPAERIAAKAISTGVSIYSAHTSLDSVNGGISWKMAEKLSLRNVKVLVPLKGKLMKLVTYVPDLHVTKVRDAIFEAGAGVVGNYDCCSFSTGGHGTFRGNESSNPFVGEKGKLHTEQETRIETIFPSALKEKILKALLMAHPYEEVAYDIYLLENEHPSAGMGCIGEIDDALTEMEFVLRLSEVFNARGLRYSELGGRHVKRVALCGGAGSSFINEAVKAGADAFVTGDLKYHDFLDARGRILLADIGHFEGEKYTTEILHDLIIKKFPTFALRFSEINTNPINYL